LAFAEANSWSLRTPAALRSANFESWDVRSSPADGGAATVCGVGPASGTAGASAALASSWAFDRCLAGAIAGVVLANLTFGLSAASIATTDRSAVGMVVAEAVVTFVLVLLILGLVRSGNGAAVAPAVGAWVAAIIIATVSTGFANPAVTIARALTDSVAGIAPSGVPAFLAAQFLAGLAAAFAAVAFYPSPAEEPGP